MRNDYVAVLLLKFGGHIVRRTCADNSFQPVFNLAVECAVDQFLHWCQWKALMFKKNVVTKTFC